MSLKALDLIQNAKLPDDLTVLDRLVLTIYANKHIDELGKAIIKRPELERQTGTHSKSVCRSINRLTKIGARVHITTGFPGQMAEYGINYKWLNNYQVTGELPKTRNRVSKSYQQEPGQLPTSDLTVTDTPPDGYPILKDLKTQRRNKENHVSIYQVKTETKDAPSVEINYNRWNVIKPYLGEFEKYIKPGPNYERLLNLLEAKGVRLKDIGAFIEKIDFTNAYSCGGRLEQELNEFAGVSKATTKPGATDWCGREGCDSRTRTWPEPSERSDGSLTSNCPYCHPNEIKQNEQVQTFNFLDELGETPFRSVDE